MANSPQARKRARQTVTRTIRNTWQETAVRTKIKKAKAAMTEKAADAIKLTRDAMAGIDRIAGKGIMHSSKASRLKARLNAMLKKSQA